MLGVAVWPGPAAASPQLAGVQVALRALGLYAGPIDGVPGPETAAGVRAAQARAHLSVTGTIDRRTRLSLGPLGSPLPGERPLVPGDFGLDVSALQFLLARSGLYDGALDGYVGPRVELAVRDFQRRHVARGRRDRRAAHLRRARRAASGAACGAAASSGPATR